MELRGFANAKANAQTRDLHETPYSGNLIMYLQSFLIHIYFPAMHRPRSITTALDHRLVYYEYSVPTYTVSSRRPFVPAGNPHILTPL